QQVRCKGQVVVCAELGLEIQLCQRQCVHIGTGQDNQRSHNIIPCTKSSQDCYCCMHGFHNREDNAPVSFPCGCSINSCRFFKSQRDILQIAGIQQQVHRHIEYGIQKDNTYSVCQAHLGSQLYNRHHQDSKRYEHTT